MIVEKTKIVDNHRYLVVNEEQMGELKTEEFDKTNLYTRVCDPPIKVKAETIVLSSDDDDHFEKNKKRKVVRGFPTCRRLKFEDI